ncbi:ZWICHEL kinesin-like calmodulin-binding protein, partial [Prunus dulcis]
KNPPSLATVATSRRRHRHHTPPLGAAPVPLGPPHFLLSIPPTTTSIRHRGRRKQPRNVAVLTDFYSTFGLSFSLISPPNWTSKICSVIAVARARHREMSVTRRDSLRFSGIPGRVLSTNPRSQKQKLFATYKEGYRKYVERYFSILQARWLIIRAVGRLFDEKILRSIMMTCIIPHNMIVEDEYDYDAL